MARAKTSIKGPRELGKVTAAERDEIKALFERKNGLTELFLCLNVLGNGELSGNDLYERLVRDMGETTAKFQQWWSEKSKTYQWENIEGCKWEIDFDTCTVYLTNQ